MRILVEISVGQIGDDTDKLWKYPVKTNTG
jgi:hypothetical protein